MLIVLLAAFTGTLADVHEAPSPFPGYQLYPETDIPGNRGANLGTFPAFSPSSQQNQATKFVCDSTPECQFHNALDDVKGHVAYGTSNSTHTYMSITKCGDPTRKGKHTSSSCAAPASAPGYFTCPVGVGSGAGIVKIATYQLPPFLVAQSCDKDDECVLFTIDFGTPLFLSHLSPFDLLTDCP